ncbi:MAG TPA: hypothetical protein VD902_16345, partial [Symbiobacteriaceae bacterium]|nr:hypothetical protein [Symbiobacteriaceae bacterium]
MKRSRRWYLLAGGLLVSAIFLLALMAPYVTRVSPEYLDARTSILLGVPAFAPDDLHPLGTDDYGRDVWSRLAFGSRWTLFFAFFIMGARMLIALPVALVAAFGPRRIGWLVDRFYVLSTAVPPLLVYLLILSVPQMRTVGLWPNLLTTVA